MRLLDLPEIDDTLRPYQISAKREIYRAWETCQTVLFQMPTGTGKTRLFSSIIKDIRRQGQAENIRKRVLVLAHRTELIQQIDETLSFKYGISHGIIKSGVEETWNRTVQVASVQTIVRRLEKWAAKDFSYIIIDEAHHAVSATYLTICKKFPDAKILGVTATPCRLTGDALRKLFGMLVISQPVSKFIEQGYLSPYYYYSIKPDSNTQRELDGINHFNVEGDYAEADMMRVFDTNKVRANIVAAYQQYAKGKKGIIYTINQAHNKHICEEFEKIGVRIKAIDSKTPTEERKNTVAQFKSGKIDILCNVNIFSEGFDCPDCEFIQLARPTCSLAMYLQQVGRGLRPHPAGIPAVILDNVGSYNKFGLPSANRQWRRHFEGEGQRVTQSSITTGNGGFYMPRKIQEGDEDMVLIFNGSSLAVQNGVEEDILISVLNTKEWFPLGACAILDNLVKSFNVRKMTKAGRWYAEYEDKEEWTDTIESEIEDERDFSFDQHEPEEIDWADKHIHSIFKFKHEGKYGLCKLICDSSQLSSEVSLYRSGKRKAEEIMTLLLEPVYDEIGIPDDHDRAICIKNGKYGVLSGDSLLPIVPFEYDALEFQGNGYYLVLKDGKVGLIDENKPILPLEYDEIMDVQVSINEMFYLVSEGDHYRLYLYTSGVQKTQQVRLNVQQHLFGDFFLGQSIKNFAFVCDENGFIKYPIGSQRIGLRKVKGKNEILIARNNVALILDEQLNERDDVLTGVPESDSKMKEELGLTALYRVYNKGIRESDEPAPVNEKKKKEKPAPKPIEPPTRVVVGENGLMGYQEEGVVILEPQYEDVIKASANRLIYKQNGRKGLLAIENGTIRKVCDPIFEDLRHNKDNTFTISQEDGHLLRLTETEMKDITFMSGAYLIFKGQDGRYTLKFHNKTIGKYREIHFITKDYFIVKESFLYGIIHCKGPEWDFFRPMEYKLIEISADKRYILLHKVGRPRFITIANLQ